MSFDRISLENISTTLAFDDIHTWRKELLVLRVDFADFRVALETPRNSAFVDESNTLTSKFSRSTSKWLVRAPHPEKSLFPGPGSGAQSIRVVIFASVYFFVRVLHVSVFRLGVQSGS